MQMIFLIRKRKIMSGLLVAALLLAFSAAVRFYKVETAFRTSQEAAVRVVLDPGHGGVDGGAVSADGTAESGINLAIALQLRELFRFIGEEPLMTRQTDISVHSEDAETIRQKKVSDLKNRVEMINRHPQAVLISIHQNSLPEAPAVHGAQAFYNTVEGAGKYAASVQKMLNLAVNDRDKAEKQIPSGIYLMSNAKIPAVLVECGFLSNAEESALLQTKQHQMKLAMAILSGYCLTEEVPK